MSAATSLPAVEPRPVADEAPGWARLTPYVWPVAVLAVGLPLLVGALVASLTMIGKPFPGFLLMSNAVVPTVSGYDWPPDHAAMFHSRVVSMDGTPVATGGAVYARVASLPVPTSVTYTFEKRGITFQRILPTRTFGATDFLQVYAILLVIGALSLGVGVTVGFLRPTTGQARVYLFLSLVGCVYVSTAVFLHRTQPAWLTDLYFVAEGLFPATLIHLALVFPAPLVLRRPWARAAAVAPYALSAVLIVAILHGFHARPPALTAIHVGYLYTVGSFAVFFLTLVLRYRLSDDARVLLRVRVLFPSVLLGGALTALTFANNAVGGGSVPLQLGLVILPVFYVSVAYAIVRHDLFGIDRAARQSFVYGLLTLIIVATYGAVLSIPVRLVPALAGEGQVMLGMAFAVVLAFAFDPVKRLVQDAVDRAFYRTRLDDRAAIGELSAAMTTLLDLPEVVSRVTDVVTDTLQLESTSLALVGDGSHPGVVWTRTADASVRRSEAPAALADIADVLDRVKKPLQRYAVAESLGDPARRDAAAAFLDDLAAGVVWPLVVRGQTIGVLALGRKRSGRLFGSADVELLRTLANQTAIAVQNARAYHALEELSRDLDRKVRDRTEELHASHGRLSRAYEELKNAQTQLVQSEKMASLGQLVAGVAHELNNPASFVHGSLATLEDFVRRLLAVVEGYEELGLAVPAERERLDAVRRNARLDYVLAEAPELLRIMREGSTRIKTIVDDLRVFGRAERGTRVATSIPDGIESTLRLLVHRLTKGRIAVRTEAADVPPVQASPAQLNQVWMNILTNALDAVEGRATPMVTIRIASVVSGDDGPTGPETWVETQVVDNGAGMPAAVVPRIFEPFFTTKPVGRGTGLGLSIAFNVVKTYGGTIRVESAMGEGTTVTVRLPADVAGAGRQTGA